MKPRDFSSLSLITYPFSVSKVNDIAVVLRSVNLFPRGLKGDLYTQVKVNEAALFLYLLASDTPVKAVEVNIDMLINLTNEAGGNFFDEFTDILKSSDKLDKIVDITIGAQLRFGEINYDDGRRERFTLRNFGEVNDYQVQKSTRLPKGFLQQFVGAILSEGTQAPHLIGGGSFQLLLERLIKVAPHEILENKPSSEHLKYVVANWKDIEGENEKIKN